MKVSQLADQDFCKTYPFHVILSQHMKLVIVESPSKSKTISKYLGDGYVVKASVGHVRDLPKSNKKAVDIEGGLFPIMKSWPKRN